MKLLLVRPLWGVDLSNGFAPHLSRWRDIGYDALEAAARLIPDASLLFRTLKNEHLSWIAQVMTNMKVPRETVREHLHSLEEQVQECLDAEPLFFNCHGGSDAWSEAEAEDFYGAAIEMEKVIGVAISHETHRSRYFGNPWNTQRILRRFPQLKLTCDLSHWVCVTERLLDDCAEIIELCTTHCHHIHARVGYEEGPQVPDPRAPEWQAHLETHEGWWATMWRSQQARGYTVSTLAPEFGPPPYMHTAPFTQQPVADLNAICDWIAERERKQFFQIVGPAASSAGGTGPAATL